MKIHTSGRIRRVAASARLNARMLGLALIATAFASSCDLHSPVDPGAVFTLTVEPNPTLAINETQQFVALALDADGREIEVTPTWTVVEGGGTISSTGLFTAGTVPGVYTATVQAVTGGMTATATVTVVVGPLTTITVTPDPETLAVDEQQLFTAIGYDAAGNIVPITPTWSIVSGGGAVNSSGNFTAGTVAGTFPFTVRATSGTISGHASVTVTPGALATITVSPNPETLPVTDSQIFTAIGYDTHGNEVAITPVWTVAAGGGSIDAGGTFTAGNTPGTYTNTVLATSGGIEGTATVNVTAGALATITVTPNPRNLVFGETQLFTAVGRDAQGNIVSISPTWAVVNGGGSINGAGNFTAGNVEGAFQNTVRATSGSVFGSATVNVSAEPLATITVTPNPDTLQVGDGRNFTAVGRDANGDIVPITPVWSVVNGGGTINTNGRFTAGSIAGEYINTVRARADGVDGFATVVVEGSVATPPLIDLGAAETHGILAGSTITCVALGTIEADASIFPGSAFTGFPPCTITGQQHAADAFAQAAQDALTSAYNQLDALPCDVTITADLGGTTLQPGVYCSGSSVGLTGEMFFDALGDPDATLVIKAPSTLTTASAQVTLLNGAQARNIYWLVGSSATIGVGSAMKGNIIAFTSITLNDNATLLGRALARNGAVTLGTGNTITLP